MRRSLLWIALGLLAASIGQGSGHGNDEQQERWMDYMCKTFNKCPTTTTTENPTVDDSCTCVKRSECRHDGDVDGELDVYNGNIYGVCNYLETCCKAEDIIPPIPKKSKECGLGAIRVRGFKTISIKNEALYGEFPWVVGIKSQNQAKPTNGSAFLSVGSLIHPQVVSHRCSPRQRSDLMVVAGEWDTGDDYEPYPTQHRIVRKVIVHEQFEGRAVLNDVALLILEQPFDLTFRHVNTICLPAPGENMDGRNCSASGWGKDKFGEEGRYQAILKNVDGLPMVPKSRCQEALRKTILGPDFKLHESFVCAGGIKGKDPCQGDGGAPLMCPTKTNPNKYVQAGIVSWGIGCNNGNPGVYVDVPHFVNWILNKLAAEDISINP